MENLDLHDHELTQVLNWMTTIDFDVWVQELMKHNVLFNDMNETIQFEIQEDQSFMKPLAESTRIDENHVCCHCKEKSTRSVDAKNINTTQQYQTGYINDPIVID